VKIVVPQREPLVVSIHLHNTSRCENLRQSFVEFGVIEIGGRDVATPFSFLRIRAEITVLADCSEMLETQLIQDY
jgi:hypothetical protein